MPFLGLWKQVGTTVTPATPTAGVDVTSSSGTLSFFGGTPTTQQTIPAELAPSASLADVIAYIGTESNALLDYNLVTR